MLSTKKGHGNTDHRINLSDLVTDQGTQVREALCAATVSEYAELYRDGGPTALPPVIVFSDGITNWLADGFHRVAGADEAGLKNLPAEIRTGTVRDAVLHACGANASHGLRRSNADKRRAVETLLNDPEWVTKTDSWIADVCHVSQPFVGKLRAAGKYNVLVRETRGGGKYRTTGSTPSRLDELEAEIERGLKITGHSSLTEYVESLQDDS